MAKLSFEEYMKAREEYAAYVKDEEPAAAPAPATKPEPVPDPTPDQQPEPSPMGPAEDYRAELNEIREQMKLMAKALSPSLGDVQPVGIDDVVSNFFKQS